MLRGRGVDNLKLVLSGRFMRGQDKLQSRGEVGRGEGGNKTLKIVEN